MAARPRIACFHGGGSNANIYRIQCTRLQHLVSSDLEFVYFEAPFERTAGPGVLPYFADQAPFKTWFKIDERGEEVSDGSGYDEQGMGGLERVFAMMEAEGGTWVGAMGFSQGTRIVGGLLLDQQLRREQGLPAKTNLKFGVLCMGSRSPMVSQINQGMCPMPGRKMC